MFLLRQNVKLVFTFSQRCCSSIQVYVTYHDEEDYPDGFECEILGLPNWSFSYALSLFRLYEENQADEQAKEKADEAIQSALLNFPSVIGQILAKNEVDTTSRSMRTDWPSVLDFVSNLESRFQHTLSDAAKADPVVRACTLQAYETIVRIFVQQNFKLWSSWAVTKWLHENLEVLRNKNKDEELNTTPLFPAIMRYARCDPTDYEDKFQTMPAEANPLDPNVVAHAMQVNQNRGRLLQRMPRGQGANPDDAELAAFLNGGGANFAGPPTVRIDPDLPLLEVRWPE